MSDRCSHPDCPYNGPCQRTHTVKAWFRQHPDPDADHGPDGSQPSGEDPDVIEKIPESTHQDDALDTLVSRASIPNLGALIKQGIKQGLIAPTATYN